MKLPRLYAILDVGLAEARGLSPLRLFDIWLDAGVRLVQLRAKTLRSGEMLALAEVLSERARLTGAIFIVNDRADIARLSRASGVHLGQTDLAPVDVRRLLASPALIGLSTHSDAQVDAALDQPVDYVAIGPVFDTSSKERPDAVVGLAGVSRAAQRARARCPVVAIGGIAMDRATAVIDAGADSVAVISDLLVGDPAARARLWLSTLDG